MKNKKNRKIIIIIAILLIVSTIIGSYLYFINSDKIQEIINNDLKKNKIMDNYNGVYVKKEEVKEAYSAYPGCTIKSIDKYIVVINKKYETYRHTCMGTYKISEGNTTELKIDYDKDSEKYKINYLDDEYNKNTSIQEIIPNNDIKEKLKTINLESYKFILQETEFIGNFYEIDSSINGVTNLRMNITSSSSGFLIKFYTFDKNNPIYSYYNKSINNLPDFSSYYNKMIIIEPSLINNKYSYKLKLLSYNGIEYNLDDYLPITINNINLSNNNGIIIKKDNSSKYYNVLISNKESFCYENNNDKTEPAYYIFNVNFDTYNATLGKPTYVKTIYKDESCPYYNKIMEE